MGIKEKRLSANMTQDELANILGVGRSAVAMWETGESLPRAKTLIDLAKALDCSVEELFPAEFEAH
jgi:putative transcriptional regulator